MRVDRYKLCSYKIAIILRMGRYKLCRIKIVVILRVGRYKLRRFKVVFKVNGSRNYTSVNIVLAP